MRSTSSGRGDRLQRVGGLGIERHVEHRPKRLAGRVRHRELEHEAVQLRFGQRVGSFELDRVLRRQHAERARQAVGDAGMRHLLLLHGFEQGRLRARRGAIDLVDQDELGEDRAGSKFERRRAPGRGGVDFRTRDVGRHQVGRALHARPMQPQRRGERLGEMRLAEPGQPLDQHVAARRTRR